LSTVGIAPLTAVVSGYWAKLDTGCWVLDTVCMMLDT